MIRNLGPLNGVIINMKTIKIACFVLLILAGIFMFFFGGYDDSPGAQGLGILLAGTGAWFTYKLIRSK
jgi:hypothetical protein